MSNINFNVKPAEAFDQLGFPYPSFQWSQFRPAEARKDFSLATELLITIWTHHGSDALRKAGSYDNVALKRSARDGKLWYRAGGGKDLPRTGTAHVARLTYAIENGIPIQGVLKDYWTKQCTLTPKFRIDEVAPASDGHGWWLNIIPSGTEGLETEDFEESDVANLEHRPIVDLRTNLDKLKHQLDALPESEKDGKRRIEMRIAIRQGQNTFRRRLLSAYGNRCAVTNCDVDAVLEAAHIVPYNGPLTNRVDNGLLLRADIHTLFDLHKIWISGEEGYTMAIHPDLRGGQYAAIEGKRLRSPNKASLSPNAEHLRRHREQALANLRRGSPK